ncbi:MAG: bifunctional oligoribonuclease/PAP phosphatase NrnA [Mycoplasmataceae bacterium]|nr:bifunctional oligoribonuclease/PAP phosphatase NrnA [Mycoplasmataceae bacterium]
MKKIKKIARNILREIRKHNYIIIFHHVRPDGDCLGSQHGLKLWLQQKFPNKKIYAVGSNEELFNFLNFKFNSIPSDEILKNSLGIVVDANNIDRIVCNELLIEKKLNKLIRIDHHPVEDDFDYFYRWVDSSYCSSAEQITHFIYSIDNKPLNKEIATFLYLGIYTDSGRFFYDYTSSRTHELTSWLFSSNFDFFDLHKKLSKRTISELKLNKYILENYKTYENVIYCFLPFEQIQKIGINQSESNRVDFLANIEGYDIWILFIENNDKTIRARLRSSEKDISILAQEYGGGGHKKASGALLNNVEQIEQLIKKASKLTLK